MSYTIPFAIPFQAQMSSPQVRWLREELSLTFHVNPVLAPDLPYAFGSLDRFSGLFLVKGGDDSHWTLECRAYRTPTDDQLAAWRAQAEWVVAALPADGNGTTE